MKPINGFKSEAPAAGSKMLPKGLYIGQIKNVKLEGTEPDQHLVLRIDITEGEYTNYYTDRYKADQERGSQYGVKYKGDFYLQIPNEDNRKREHFDWDMRSFNNAIWAIEDSNKGYHWDWNEACLKGKAVGINVRQGSYNGIPYTTIGRLESTRMISEGKCRLMPDMKPRGTTTESAAPADYPVDEEVPF